MYNIINIIDIYLNSIKIEIACTTNDEMLLVKDSRRERERSTEKKERETKRKRSEGLTLCFSFAVRNAGRIGVHLRAICYRGGNGGGSRRGCGCDRRRIRIRGPLLLLLGVL